jgi:hypothetical protein
MKLVVKFLNLFAGFREWMILRSMKSSFIH